MEQEQFKGGVSNASAFSKISLAPPDPILGTALAFKADASKDKMNLGN